MIFDKCYSADGTESNCFSIFSLLLLVVLIVAGVMYATYLFIDATKIPNIAGVHVSKNIFLAAKSVQGKLYTNEDKGIKDWIIFKDAAIGYGIKYPNDMEISKTSDDKLEIKKPNQNTSSKNQSLLFAAVVGEYSGDENLNEIDFLKKKYPDWNGKIKKDFYGNKEGFRTGVFKSVEGINKDVVIWNVGNRKIYIESRYYSEDISPYADIFNKIISEFNIT